MIRAAQDMKPSRKYVHVRLVRLTSIGKIPMSDLVSRLRVCEAISTSLKFQKLAGKAADEIERLRQHIDELNQDRGIQSEEQDSLLTEGNLKDAVIEAAREAKDNWTHYANGQAMVHKSRLKKIAVTLSELDAAQPGQKP